MDGMDWMDGVRGTCRKGQFAQFAKLNENA
jgi:hypothetical protein